MAYDLRNCLSGCSYGRYTIAIYISALVTIYERSGLEQSKR